MRRVIVDALSGRPVVAGPEEVDATQPLIFHLVQRLGWKPGQMMSRPQWRVPRTPSADRTAGFPVDLAIFDSPEFQGDPDHVRIICECKAPDEETGVGELKTYLGLEPEARLGIWFNGQAHALVYKTPDGFAVHDFAPIPRPGDPLAPWAAKRPLRFEDLDPPPNLGEVFRRLRDHIASQDSHVNRDEFILNDLANLLICKIADEQAGEMEPDRPMAFQLSPTRAATAAAIRNFFGDARQRHPSVFGDGHDRLYLDDASLETVVRTLQKFRLLGHDRHAVGKAFQVLRGRALKGQEGAYFTPAPLVDCVISILDPQHGDRVIDPGAGTGGFLAAALDHVFERVDAIKKVPESARERAKREWAQNNLFAIDKDAVSVRLCKAYLTLLGDGRSHVYRANSIDREEWVTRQDDLVRAVEFGTFNLVATNPPFGQNLKVAASIGRAEGLKVCHRWRRDGDVWKSSDTVVKQQLGLAFFERCVDLLREGGRMGIVLPETFLFSDTFRWFVDWVCRSLTVTHVVDVPMVAFEEFCRAKTCLVFIEKREPLPGHRILMSWPRSIGQDKHGNQLFKTDCAGKPTQELDNEMAPAVEELAGAGPAGPEARFRFSVSQADARRRGVLVPRYWWRKDLDTALEEWAESHPSDPVTLGELEERGILKAFPGHRSPPSTVRGKGTVPYVKVTDLKNWRINENPTNFIPVDLAARLRKSGPDLQYGDLVTPARASSNIGQFSVVMPWQTHVVLTHEVLVLRVLPNEEEIDSFLLLALLSLRVVQSQWPTLALMQTNREHLGERWREVRVPIPSTKEGRHRAGDPVRSYFDAQVVARESYTKLLTVFAVQDFGTRP